MDNSEKAKTCFTSVFRKKTLSDDQHSQCQLSKKELGKKQVTDYFDAFRSPGTDEIHPQVLKELDVIITEPLTVVFKNS